MNPVSKVSPIHSLISCALDGTVYQTQVYTEDGNLIWHINGKTKIVALTF